MNSSIPYNKLEINGALLIPSFSIYLLEIVYKEERLFYIGMTGDNFYPSARAAFHRISGHLELAERSTQNQLKLALESKGIIGEELRNTKILMYHFPIGGFKKWEVNEGSMKAEFINQAKETEHKDYIEYKENQNKVLVLENALIFKFKEKLVNNTNGKANEIPKEFQHIFDEIEKIILSPLNTEGV